MKALIKTQDLEMVCFETVMVSLFASFFFLFQGMAGLQETLMLILK